MTEPPPARVTVLLAPEMALLNCTVPPAAWLMVTLSFSVTAPERVLLLEVFLLQIVLVPLDPVRTVIGVEMVRPPTFPAIVRLALAVLVVSPNWKLGEETDPPGAVETPSCSEPALIKVSPP